MVNYPDVQVPAHAMQTFSIARPVATHFVDATCEDIDCELARDGWVTEVDETSTLGQMQAHYVRAESGRSFTEEKTREGLTRFTFRGGQPCFAQHRAPADRPSIFLVRPGDHRGNPLGTPPRVHTRPELWVEEFAETLDGVRSVRERG